jgi:hypothetical protein
MGYHHTDVKQSGPISENFRAILDECINYTLMCDPDNWDELQETGQCFLRIPPRWLVPGTLGHFGYLVYVIECGEEDLLLKWYDDLSPHHGITIYPTYMFAEVCQPPDPVSHIWPWAQLLALVFESINN